MLHFAAQVHCPVPGAAIISRTDNAGLGPPLAGLMRDGQIQPRPGAGWSHRGLLVQPPFSYTPEPHTIHH